MIVADAGPLIAFARIERLPILRIYGAVLTPPAVVRECVTDVSRPGAIAIRAALADGLIRETKSSTKSGAPAVLIGAGESEAIMLASERELELLVDDAQARRTARETGVKVVGTWGTLLRAKALGEIDRVEPLIESLQAQGYWASEDLVAEVLRAAGESSRRKA